ncbi:hypothetical protein Tco_0767121, partial [Tanacetum coccineum]
GEGALAISLHLFRVASYDLAVGDVKDFVVGYCLQITTFLGNHHKPFCWELKVFILSTAKPRVSTAQVTTASPVTTKEKAQKKNDVKARSMLLMALPNEYLITFNQYKDAKTLFASIQTIFSDYALWDMIENGNLFKPAAKTTTYVDGTSTTLIPCLITTKEKAQKENDVKAKKNALENCKSAGYLSTASTQDSTANLSDATVYAFLASKPNGSQLVHEDFVQIHKDDLEEMDLKWQLALLSMRTRREFRGPRNQDSKNMNQDNSRRTVNVEETSSKAMLAIYGAGFDWSYMADDEVPTNMALMAFLDSKNRV